MNDVVNVTQLDTSGHTYSTWSAAVNVPPKRANPLAFGKRLGEDGNGDDGDGDDGNGDDGVSACRIISLIYLQSIFCTST